MNKWQMEGLSFDEETHTYLLDGSLVAGVTSIMSDVGLVDYSGVAPDLLQRSADFGKMAHLYTAYRDLGVLDESSIPGEMKVILDLWEDFKRDHNVKMINVERPVASRVWKFACTPDRVAEVEGKLAVIEFKTTYNISKSVKWQLAGQQICLEENGFDIKERWAVQIKNGKMAVKHYPISELRVDKSVITSAVTVYNAKRGAK